MNMLEIKHGVLKITMLGKGVGEGWIGSLGISDTKHYI